MDTIDFSEEHAIVEKVLTDLDCFYSRPDKVRTLRIFDRDSGHFLLIDEGWQGYRHLHSLWAHVEYCDGKFWIIEDGTEQGIANLLVEEGIAKSQIVLAFYEPAMRDATEFAVA